MLTALPRPRARNDGDPARAATAPTGGLHHRRGRRRRRGLTPTPPTTIVEDAYELVAELIGEDLELIRAAVLDARNAVAAASAIDALDHIGPALRVGGDDDAA